MDLNELREFCLAKRGTTEEFPFDKDTLVFKVMGKMYALLPLERWERGEPSINLKCDPDYALELRASYPGITGGYHMSKTHWNTLNLENGDIPVSMVYKLVDHSYEMVVKGMPARLRKELEKL